ncbi:unnamed protein product [Closterium sp. Yama58-4]|nr:unnamed protein product [Closterium sp. Yama58-4]
MGLPREAPRGGPDNARNAFRGVRQRKWGSWVAEIPHPRLRTRVWLGSFRTAEAAARAYDRAALKLMGPTAVFNFPQPQASPDGLALGPEAAPEAAPATAPAAAPGTAEVAAPEQAEAHLLTEAQSGPDRNQGDLCSKTRVPHVAESETIRALTPPVVSPLTNSSAAAGVSASPLPAVTNFASRLSLSACPFSPAAADPTVGTHTNFPALTAVESGSRTPAAATPTTRTCAGVSEGHVRAQMLHRLLSPSRDNRRPQMLTHAEASAVGATTVVDACPITAVGNRLPSLPRHVPTLLSHQPTLPGHVSASVGMLVALEPFPPQNRNASLHSATAATSNTDVSRKRSWQQAEMPIQSHQSVRTVTPMDGQLKALLLELEGEEESRVSEASWAERSKQVETLLLELEEEERRVKTRAWDGQPEQDRTVLPGLNSPQQMQYVVHAALEPVASFPQMHSVQHVHMLALQHPAQHAYVPAQKHPATPVHVPGQQQSHMGALLDSLLQQLEATQEYEMMLLAQAIEAQRREEERVSVLHPLDSPALPRFQPVLLPPYASPLASSHQQSVKPLASHNNVASLEPHTPTQSHFPSMGRIGSHSASVEDFELDFLADIMNTWS